jgi:hypothetical protein
LVSLDRHPVVYHCVFFNQLDECMLVIFCVKTVTNK